MWGAYKGEETKPQKPEWQPYLRRRGVCKSLPHALQGAETLRDMRQS